MQCWLVFFIAMLSLVACGSQQALDFRFSDAEPVSASSLTEPRPVRVAVAAVISPKGNVESYAELLDYLGRKLQRRIELVQRQTYAEVNDLIRSGDVDIAFVCTSAYISGKREFGMQLLVAPQVRGESVYYSLLLVPADSPVRSMADLRGKVFAFTDPLSLSGRLYPTSLVKAYGSTPERFFSRVFYTYSHDNAIRAVADKVVDGANVDSLVYDFMTARESALAARVRIVDRSPAFGIPPVVVGPGASPQFRETVRELFLQMDEDPAGQAALRSLLIERFIPGSDQNYDSARALEAQVNTTQ
ncbi:MAG: phosphate/phosphite/phosphonate ABC transporter substrate-binding protein [Chloroflexi bacterium]|nr:phosphate/phosphite/phosphonate ABC transporter substrate-binding protein [Chloroflexota bacterium]